MVRLLFTLEILLFLVNTVFSKTAEYLQLIAHL